jgi:hypothetical protein
MLHQEIMTKKTDFSPKLPDFSLNIFLGGSLNFRVWGLGFKDLENLLGFGFWEKIRFF